MVCFICRDLEQAFKARLSEYIAARSSAYFRVSRKLAALKNVDMERAKNDLEEHQLVCVSAAAVKRSGPRALRLDSNARAACWKRSIAESGLPV